MMNKRNSGDSESSEGEGRSDKPGGRKKPRPADVVAACNHEVRRWMLRSLGGSEKPRSPSELAPQAEVGVSNASYHMAILADYEVVELVDERPVRGALEHLYEPLVADCEMTNLILRETEPDDERNRRERRENGRR